MYAVQKQQRERVIVTRKNIKIMRERESIRSHADFLCFVTKPDACSDTCSSPEKMRALKTRLLSLKLCLVNSQLSLYAHALDIHSFRTFLFLTFFVHILYRVQCERSDPLTWARKKIRITDRACKPGLT